VSDGHDGLKTTVLYRPLVSMPSASSGIFSPRPQTTMIGRARETRLKLDFQVLAFAELCVPSGQTGPVPSRHQGAIEVRGAHLSPRSMDRIHG